MLIAQAGLLHVPSGDTVNRAVKELGLELPAEEELKVELEEVEKVEEVEELEEVE